MIMLYFKCNPFKNTIAPQGESPLNVSISKVSLPYILFKLKSNIFILKNNVPVK